VDGYRIEWRDGVAQYRTLEDAMNVAGTKPGIVLIYDSGHVLTVVRDGIELMDADEIADATVGFMEKRGKPLP
jgi:hypothetical protein